MIAAPLPPEMTHLRHPPVGAETSASLLREAAGRTLIRDHRPLAADRGLQGIVMVKIPLTVGFDKI
jgi:hypothetical protein